MWKDITVCEQQRTGIQNRRLDKEIKYGIHESYFALIQMCPSRSQFHDEDTKIFNTAVIVCTLHHVN